MEFRKYDKVHRLGKDETLGILEGVCHVEEKIDGANLSIWLESDGLHVGSRNNDLTRNGNSFNGAVEYCNNHLGIQKLLSVYPECRLYGEWLVKHTIDYSATAYKKFYLFDIYTEQNGFMDPLVVHGIAEEYGIDHVPYLGTFISPTLEQLNQLITKSKFGEFQEGIVIKNTEFRNQFGDFCYAKIVQEAFLEDNGIAFGGNNKYSECYWEQYVSNKYVTLERVKKIMNKLQPEINEKLDMKHIPRIISTVYHDIIQEEGWEISNKAETINFNTLKRICSKKIKQVYCDVLTDRISVADM